MGRRKKEENRKHRVIQGRICLNQTDWGIEYPYVFESANACYACQRFEPTDAALEETRCGTCRMERKYAIDQKYYNCKNYEESHIPWCTECRRKVAG